MKLKMRREDEGVEKRRERGEERREREEGKCW